MTLEKLKLLQEQYNKSNPESQIDIEFINEEADEEMKLLFEEDDNINATIQQLISWSKENGHL